LGYAVERDRKRNSGRLVVTGLGHRFEVFVQGTRGWRNDPLWLERRLQLSPDRWAAVVRFPDETSEPELYLIPTTDWRNPELPLDNPQYDASGLSSKPEYRVRVTRRNYAALQRYRWQHRSRELPR